MKRYLAATVCLVLLAWTAQVGSAQGNEWAEYVYADDGFAIFAPAEPFRETGTVRGVGGPVELHYYSIPLGHDSGFMVIHGRLHPDDQRSPQRVLTDAENGTVRGVRGSLIAEIPVSLGDYPGLQIEVEAGKYHSRNRYYVVERTLYQLLSVAPMGRPISPETDRFFNSFRLVDSSR